MTLMDRLALIRAGYKASEIREMEKEGTEPHEPQQMEPRDGLDQQQDAAAAGTQGTDPAPAAQGEETGENPTDADPRDEKIAELTRQLEAVRRANIDQNNGKPYGDDEYIRDVFNRTH